MSGWMPGSLLVEAPVYRYATPLNAESARTSGEQRLKQAQTIIHRWPLARTPTHLCRVHRNLLWVALSIAWSQPAPGAIGGTVVDPNGNVVAAALVKLASPGQAAKQEIVADGNGHFLLTAVPPGPFQLTISAFGFGTAVRTGVLHPGETFQQPDIALPVGLATTEVRVSMTQVELAQEQIQVEEKQRVFGVIPNFYISYDHAAVPLTPRQKFDLAWKTSFDPVTFAATGVVAGIEQANNDFSGYGQGTKGYAKRYGAAYADGFIGAMIGGGLLPSVLKQDPRYFYKGEGTTRSRVLYALANAVVCKGDNGHWEPNYSGIIGGLAAGGISNLYYPAANRDGAAVTFEGAAIGVGSGAIANLFQEFFIRKLTPHTHGPQP
jgi:hypothetical protein